MKMVTLELRVPVDDDVKPEHVRDLCANHLYFAQWECASGKVYWNDVKAWKAKVES